MNFIECPLPNYIFKLAVKPRFEILSDTIRRGSLPTQDGK